MRRPVGRVLLGVLSAMAALYLLCANVLLRTRLLRVLLSGSPEKLTVEYATAYSLLPGRVHVERLRIRGSDSRVQWILRLDRCDFHFWPLDLLRWRFHASHVRADGVSFRLRQKLTRAEATPGRLAALPPLEGFRDPPYKSATPPQPVTDAAYNLLSVRLDDVVAENVTEVWVDTARLAGDLAVRGRWLFRPLRWLEVGPATTRIRSLSVSHGAEGPIVTDLAGEAVVTIAGFDVRGAHGLEILEHLSLWADVDGAIDAGAALRAAAGEGSRGRLSGEGAIEARVALSHGKLMAGSRVAARTPDTAIAALGLEVRADAAAELLADAGSEGDAARVRLDLKSLVLAREGVPLLRAPSASLTVRGLETDLAHPTAARATLDGEVEAAHADSLAPLHTLILARSGYDVRSGPVHGRLQVHGSVSPRFTEGAPSPRASVDLDLSVSSLAISDPHHRVALLGDAELRASRASVDLPGRAVSLADADVVLRDVRVSDLRADGALLLESPRVAAHARDVRACACGEQGTQAMRGTVALEVPRSELPDLRAVSRLRMLPHMIGAEGGRGEARLSAVADLGARTLTGEAHATTTGLVLRLGTESIATDLELTVRMRGMGARSQTTDLSGSSLVATKAAHASGAGRGWARLVAPEATLIAGDEPRLEAELRLEANDRAKAPALLAGATGVPRWLAALAPSEPLHGRADIAVSPSWSDVRGLEAQEGNVRVRVEYARRGAAKQGAALLQIRDAYLGVNLAGTGPRFVLFGAPSWFRRKATAIEGAHRFVSGVE